MNRRSILAALLVGLASSALAADMPGTVFNQAADLAAGKPAGTTYDGSPARVSVRNEVAGALTAGPLSVPSVVNTPASSRDILRPAAVPSPNKESGNEGFFSGTGLKFGAAGAAAFALGGWLLGGPIGALIGAVAGFAIGFVMSKLLR